MRNYRIDDDGNWIDLAVEQAESMRRLADRFDMIDAERNEARKSKEDAAKVRSIKEDKKKSTEQFIKLLEAPEQGEEFSAEELKQGTK